MTGHDPVAASPRALDASPALGREIGRLPPAANLDDSALPSSWGVDVRLQSIRADSPELKHLRTNFSDGSGEPVGAPAVFSIHSGPDVIDVLPWFIRNEELYVGVITTLSPARAVRGAVQRDASHWHTRLSSVKVGESPEQDALDVLRRECALTVKGEPIPLGGGYFPSSGTSSFMGRALAVQVYSPEELPRRECISDGLPAESRFLPATELVRDYLAGKLHDTRLVEAVFRLADKLKLELKLPLSISPRADYGGIPEVEGRISSPQRVAADLASLRRRAGIVTSLSITPVAAPATPFLKVQPATLSITPPTGGEAREVAASTVLRRGLDSVDAGAWFLCRGRPVMVLKLGVRPGVAFHDAEHGGPAAKSGWCIEGVAGSLEGESEGADILRRAQTEIEEEVGMAVAEDGIIVGSEYPALEVTPERVIRTLIEINPTTSVEAERSVDETQHVWFIDVNDVLDMLRSGALRGARLGLTAHLLRAAVENGRKRNDAPRLESFSALSGRIGIFGGTFDPIHRDHIRVAREMMVRHSLDSVVFVPTAQNPFKQHQPQAAEYERLALIEAGLADQPGMYVSDIELQLGPVGRTVDTLHAIRSELSEKAGLYFILGADVLTGLAAWKDAQGCAELLDGILVAHREGHAAVPVGELRTVLPGRMVDEIVRDSARPSRALPLSSSETRKALAAGEQPGRFVPPLVAAEIARRQLYGFRA